MQKIFSNEKGLTLVEVIISFAILVIIAFAFIPLFGNVFANIFFFGEKDKAMTQASDYMEVLYAEQPFGADNEIIALLELNNGTYVDNENNLLNYDENFEFNFTLDSFETIDVTGYKVTIVVFYENGGQHAKLTSFFRKG